MRELEGGDLQKPPLLDVQEAHSTLSNPHRRTPYDRSRFGEKHAVRETGTDRR
jgi:hypothetical protein